MLHTPYSFQLCAYNFPNHSSWFWMLFHFLWKSQFSFPEFWYAKTINHFCVYRLRFGTQDSEWSYLLPLWMLVFIDWYLHFLSHSSLSKDQISQANLILLRTLLAFFLPELYISCYLQISKMLEPSLDLCILSTGLMISIHWFHSFGHGLMQHCRFSRSSLAYYSKYFKILWSFTF